MLFRSTASAIALLITVVASAQRPTANFINGPLFRLELEGHRVFVDAPPNGGNGMRADDIALYTRTPAAAPVCSAAFTPDLKGEALDRFSAEVGERTGIYVHATPDTVDNAAHATYLIHWNGRRMWFCGESTDPDVLLNMAELDVAFVSPALMKAIEAKGRTIDARTVVIYHTSNKEQQDQGLSVPCDRCKTVLPFPGDVIQLFRQ